MSLAWGNNNASSLPTQNEGSFFTNISLDFINNPAAMASILSQSQSQSTSTPLKGDAERMQLQKRVQEREKLLYKLRSGTYNNAESYGDASKRICELRGVTVDIVDGVLAWRGAMGAGPINPGLSLPSIFSVANANASASASATATATANAGTTANPPSPFLYKGENYLIKMLDDCEDLDLSLLPLGVNPNRNPFLLLLNVDR